MVLAYLYTYIWVILFGQMLVNIPYMEHMGYRMVPPSYKLVYKPHENYMSNRKNPGNTKYVFDGHWFMEIDGNC